MKTKIILPIIFTILMSLGCNTSTRPGITANYDFRTGSRGIVMNFVDNAPANILYENSDFIIGADIANVGAYNIKDGLLSLSVEDDYMSINNWVGSPITQSNPDDKTATFTLEGKAVDNQIGGLARVSIRAKTRALEEQSETHTSIIVLTSCYQYTTFLSQEVCIDPDIYKTKPTNKVCEVKPMILSNQGAPVAITGIDPFMLSGDDGLVRPQFIIYIKNVGDGKVFDVKRVQEACSSAALAKDDINYVTVSAKLTDRALTCNPQPLRLVKGENSVKCVLDNGFERGGTSFIAPLVIQVGYAYASSISKSVVIKRIIK